MGPSLIPFASQKGTRRHESRRAGEVCQAGKRALFSRRSLLLEQSTYESPTAHNPITPRWTFFFAVYYIKIECKSKQIASLHAQQGSMREKWFDIGRLWHANGDNPSGKRHTKRPFEWSNKHCCDKASVCVCACLTLNASFFKDPIKSELDGF